MDRDRQKTMRADALRGDGPTPMRRRDALRLLSGLGLTAAGAAAIEVGGLGSVSTRAASVNAAAHDALHAAPRRQNAGTPAATPEIGLRPDGTRRWRVQVAGDSEPDLVEYMTFFPKDLTIDAGDSVFFDFKGLHAPHTVTFLSGQEPPPLIVPAAGGTPSAATAAAENPPSLMFNPAAAFPMGGLAYDGTGIVNSGLSALLPPGQGYTLTFTTPGAYDYLCLVHPLMMKGTVIVQPQGAALPHEPADLDAIVAAHIAELRDQGKALAATYSTVATPTAGPDGRTIWEVRAGAEGDEIALLRFFPDHLTIKSGDAVRWTDRSQYEPHTVTFLGGGAPPDLIVPEPQAGGPPKLTFNPAVVGRVGPAVYHGTGYANSGAMGADFASFTRRTTYELTFDTPGDFAYYCALHGSPTMGMRATVSVA